MEKSVPDIVQKWGVSVAERGFAQVPNYLLLINNFIDPEFALKPLELLILLQLVGSWWKKGDQPFPSMKTLAVRCGASERQVHRAIANLEELNLLAKTKRRSKGIISSNAYDLQPLVDMLNEIAKAFVNESPRNVGAGISASSDGTVKIRSEAGVVIRPSSKK